MSETEYLAAIANGEGGDSTSELIIVTNTRSSTGVALSYTPPDGKDFYLSEASCVFVAASIGTSPIIGTGRATLRNDSAIKDYFGASVTSGHTNNNIYGTGGHSKTESKAKGDKLVGDALKAYDIDITAIGNSTAAYCTIKGVLVTSGKSPKLD